MKMSISCKVIALLTCLFSVSRLFGGEYPLTSNISLNDMKIYFDRADRESDRDLWLSTAFAGIAIVNENEREKALSDMKERLARWQWRNIEKQLELPELEALLAKISENDYAYLYELENGEISFDENGKPVFKGLSGLEDDAAEWENRIKNVIASIFDEWESQASIKYSEILNIEQSWPADIQEIISVSFSDYRNRVKNEFEYIYLSGKKNFIARRSLDSFSMKKESESESASEIASRRIGEVQVSLMNASEKLEAEMDALKDTPAEAVYVKMDEWEESFKTEFENGIKKWEDAEKAFLAERVRWEKDAREGYIRAEEDWDRAMSDFLQARGEWITGMQEIIESGREYWQEREYDFFTSYREVTEKIEEASVKEKIRFEKEISSYLSIYTESRNIESMAEENIKYLDDEIKRINRYKTEKQKIVDRYRGEIDKINGKISEYNSYIRLMYEKIEKERDDDGTSWGAISRYESNIRLYTQKIEEQELLLPDLIAKLKSAVEFERAKDNELAAYIEELAFWQSAGKEYRAGRIKAEENLIGLEEEIITGIYGRDEFESELAILKDRQDILQRKLEIAEHVYRYSLDHTSERERKADTEARYNQALGSFREMEEIYFLKIAELDSFVEYELAGSEASIEAKKAVLNEAETALENLRNEYEAAMEIFRLKDSSLLETTISNLEKDIESYYSKDMENAWSAYFGHMEKSLRNEKGWYALELIDDIEGCGEEDNHTDIGILEGKKTFLETLVVDFDNPETETLKTTLVLEGFAVTGNNGPLSRFLESLEAGMTEKALFYYELAVLEAEKNYTKSLKAVEILSLSESEKSVHELVAEIEDALAFAREGFFEYENSGIIPFLLLADPDASEFDITDPGFMERIRNIAMLESELSAVNEYAPYSTAFDSFERESLYNTLAGMIALVEEEGLRDTGISAMFENEEEVLEFYEALYKIEFLPVYIIEALEKALEPVIQKRKFTFDYNTIAEEEELAGFIARIENYDGSEELSLYELEEKRDELSLKIDSVKAARSLYERTVSKSYSMEEKSCREALLLKSLDTLLMELDFITNQEIAREKRNTALSLDAGNTGNELMLEELTEKLALWQNEQAVYFEENIAEKKAALEEARLRLSAERMEFQNLLEVFTELTEEYRGRKKAVDDAFVLYNESKWELYEAEELKDFAFSPYALENTDPLALLEKRRNELERVESIYSALSGISESVKRKSYAENLDPGYLDCLRGKAELVSSVNYLSESVDRLGQEISRAQEQAGRFYTAIKDSMQGMFRYDLNFVPEIDSLEGEITDFTGISGKAAIKNAINSYFSQQNADVIYSNDTLRWAYSLFAKGEGQANSMLKKFGIAYYSEFKSEVNVPIYSDQNFNELTRGKYADCDPEDHADDYAKEILSEIKNNTELNILYCFFRAMVLSGKTTFDSAFMGKDVSQIAHDYLWDVSKKEERYIKKHHWLSNFWNRTAKKMSTMRHNMTDINGKEERGMLFSSISKAFAARENFLEKKAEIALLSGGDGETDVSFEEFLASLKEVSGNLPAEAGSGFRDILEGIYNEAENRKTSYLLACEVLTQLSGNLSEKETELSILARNLDMERKIAVSNYRQGLYDDEKEISVIKDEVISLFYNPSYSPKESAEAGFETILSSYSGDLSGRERTLYIAAVNLAGLFSSLVDISINENDMVIRNSYLELLDKKKGWEERIAELYETGVVEWNSGFDTLAGKRKRWQEEFQKEAVMKEELWNAKYTLFEENRKKWIDESTLSAARGESVRLAREMGISAEKLLAETESIIIPDMRKAGALGDMVREVTDQALLSSLVQSARYYSQKKETEQTVICSYLPGIGTYGNGGQAVESYAEDLAGEIRKRSALLKALKMAKTVTELEEGIRENIDLANRGTEKALSDTLTGKGYKKKGDYFTRKAIIDMTLLGGIEEETHEIKGYKHFKAPEFKTGVDLSKSSLENIGEGEIQMRIEKAVCDLKRYSDLVFGGKTASDASVWAGFDQEFLKHVKSAEKGFRASEQAGKYSDTKGLFYMHLGYAPVMKDKEPEKVKTEGYGEYGRIYKLYLRNEARLGRGIACLDVPWYSQKLWDDDKNNDGKSDGFLGAPSVRSLGNIAMTIMAGTGPFAFALNMLDDIAFTAMDIGEGVIDWDDGMANIGKQAAVSYATRGIGEKYGKIETNNILTSTAAAGLKTASVNLTSTAINSFDFNSQGLYFNTDTFGRNWQEDLYGKGAVSGYISGMGAAALDSTLTGFYGNDLAYGKALSGTIAGTAASVYEYNALGSTKLNVFNFRGTGLLELNVGGDGSLFDIGMGGQDVSAGTLAASYKGLNTYYQNARISFSGKDNIRDARVGMRALYSAGRQDEKAVELYKNLLSGKDRLEVDKGLRGGAETVLDYETGGKVLRLSSLGNNKMERLHLGVVLAHEAYRDGVVSDSNSLETREAVRAHIRVAEDIDKDYKGFLGSNLHLKAESGLLEIAERTGIEDLFNGYVDKAYNSIDGDFYFPEFKDFGMKQNLDAGNDKITLGYDEKEVNGARFDAQYRKYLADEGLSPDIFSRDSFIALWENNEKVKDIYKVDIYKNETIAEVGCNLYSLLYIQQTLTNNVITGKDANEKLKAGNQFAAGNLLLTDSTKALSILAEGKYEFSFESYGNDSDTEKAIIERLESARDSEDPECIRVFTGKHFMVLKDFTTAVDDNGNTYISEIEVLNPWKDGKTTYSGNEIKRFDIFKAQENNTVQIPETVVRENVAVKLPVEESNFMNWGFVW